MRHRQALLVVRSRRVRVAGIARTDRVRHGPNIVRSPGVETALGIDCLREQPRSAMAIEFASPARRRVLSPQGYGAHVFQCLCWACAEGARETPARSVRLRQGHRAVGVTPVGVRHRPHSQNQKPTPHAPWRKSRLWWHSDSGPRILAAGPAVYDSTPIPSVYVNQTSIVCSAHPRARASADSSPAAGSSPGARPRRNH